MHHVFQHITLALVVAAAATSSPLSAAELERRLSVMGTWLTITVEAPTRTTAIEAADAAVRAVNATNDRLSTWLEDSELSRLNRSPAGLSFFVSPELAHDLDEALGWWRRTDGAFHPGLGALVRAWDLRGRGRIPSATEILAALRSSAMEALIITDGQVERRDPDFTFEEGAFAKGTALRAAGRAALEHGAIRADFDFGGQLLFAGKGRNRTIGLAHPADRAAIVAELSTSHRSIATSGSSERAFEVSDTLFSHVLDPRTGRPIAFAGSVTVLTADPVAADCLATALLVMGVDEGMDWLERHPEIDAVFAVATGDAVILTATPGIAPYIQTMKPPHCLSPSLPNPAL